MTRGAWLSTAPTAPNQPCTARGQQGPVELRGTLVPQSPSQPLGPKHRANAALGAEMWTCEGAAPGHGEEAPSTRGCTQHLFQKLFLGTKVGVRGKDGFIGQKEKVFSRGCWLGVTHPQQLSLLPGQAWHRFLILTQLPGQSRAHPGPSHPARLAAGEGSKEGMSPLPPHLPLQEVESLRGNHGNPPLPLWEHS